MAETPSVMLALGTVAPAFSLPDTVSGRSLSVADVKGPRGLLVAFICNHCPYAVNLEGALSSIGKDYIAKGVGVVAISSNDAVAYPDDSAEGCRLQAIRAGFTFPYLYDESQAVAKAYKAACTPDFFLFDGAAKLYYRGQLDSSRPEKGTPDGRDMRAALDLLVAGSPAPVKQTPSLGCNIKWKPGNAPDYYRH